MVRHVALMGVAAIFTVALVGCGAADGDLGEEAIGTAHQAELDPGELDWRIYFFNYETFGRLASVLVINDEDVGAFDAKTEYWHVDTSVVGDLGSEGLELSHLDGYGTPPSLSGDQEFRMARDLTWVSFSSDPVSGGALYKSGNQSFRIASDSSGFTQLTWYQATSGSAANVTMDGTFTVVEDAPAVTVPSGLNGYYINHGVQ